MVNNKQDVIDDECNPEDEIDYDQEVVIQDNVLVVKDFVLPVTALPESEPILVRPCHDCNDYCGGLIV